MQLSQRIELQQFRISHLNWRLNLNNNTWNILSLTLMFQDKGVFT